ncbi:MAG TPA: MarR family transcriptional regulator [bacterium]|nr:MarR family transcriptional regulator [bacterium]
MAMVRRSSPGKSTTSAATASHDVRAALDAVRRIVQGLRVAGREGERRAGLSSAQLFALQQIGEHPRASVNELAALTFTHQSSVSVVIQRLVERRLVAKVTATDDRRRLRLELTAKGRAVLGRAPAAVQERLIAAIAALAPGDRRVLARALGHVARAVAPKDAAAHPPMFFEDGAQSKKG